MRIGVVLYGQPRDYLKGYHNIMNFIHQQENCEFDFFYHSWKLNENEIYKSSPWRKCDEKHLTYKESTISHLQNLYHPLSYEIENQNEITFDESLYINTLAFKNTESPSLLQNIDNILFQLYSRNKARNQIDTYLKTEKKVQYDFIMMLRFDVDIMPVIHFNEINKSNVYVSNYHCPRKIIPDSCIIAPTHIFLEWFTIYENLKDILDNASLFENVVSFGERVIINAEQLIFAKYILHYKNTDNILYFEGGL